MLFHAYTCVQLSQICPYSNFIQAPKDAVIFQQAPAYVPLPYLQEWHKGMPNIANRKHAVRMERADDID